MHNLHLLDSFFEFYHSDIKPIIELDEYLDWLNTLPINYRNTYILMDFESGKNDNAFAWNCLEKRGWFLEDFIGYCEPDENSEML